jgi:hypothetical protein
MKNYVIKFDGSQEDFSRKKVYDSAKRVGASNSLAIKISEEIESKVYSGIKTSDIYREVKKLLKEEDHKSALRFSLKKAISNLGPSGFPFEKYVGEIFSLQGYKVKLNQQIAGKCGVYEIDFVAEKNGIIHIGECKYRNLTDGKVHSKDALANYARYLDIKGDRSDIKSILVTNNKFTSKAERYCKCVGVDILGWRYPSRGLEYLIESQGLYPITILPGLNKHLGSLFVEKGIILAKDVLNKDIKKIIKIPARDLDNLIKQAKVLLDDNL